MRAPAAFSMLMMRLAWAGVILLPLPAYALELWLENVYRAFSEHDPSGLVGPLERHGVGRDLAIFAVAVLVTAGVLPRIHPRRAIERLRRRARTGLDPLHPGTHRAPPALALIVILTLQR